MSTVVIKKTMLIDFSWKPTAGEQSSWFSFDEQEKIRVGIKQQSDAKVNPAGKVVLYLFSQCPSRRGFNIYQVHFQFVGVAGATAKRMNKKIDKKMLLLFTFEEDVNPEGMSIRFWIYMSEVEPNYSHQPVDKRITQLFAGAQNELFTDIEFIVDGDTYPAHRAIVAARSPVFAAMFRTDMLESKTRKVEIKDVKSATFYSLLYFIYTGTLDCAVNGDLFNAADKYQVETLRCLCQAASYEQDPDELVAKIIEAVI